jgi:transglutaminase-like putative cysteine protease
MSKFTIKHSTVHRYARPVALGQHRLMFRPRDSHDLRLIDARLFVTPAPQETRWVHDVFGNSITLMTFQGETDLLEIVSTIELEHFGLDRPLVPLEPYAAFYPFSYPFDELPDLSRSIERQYPDPNHEVDRWARRFVAGNGGGGAMPTQLLLEEMTRAIPRDFAYRSRWEPGVQDPVETLYRRSGTCRDFALFMMEAARALGFAARFVSGYLYDAAVDPNFNVGGQALLGSGATHAWVQIYLPGAGWVEFDPTNGLFGGANLFRVAVARDPSQAIPLQGSYAGDVDDILSEEITVSVRRNP